jgi:hypothetical protein
MAKTAKIDEGPGFARFILVWSSLSPVFVLWAVRGVNKIPDEIWIPVCTGLFVVPNLLLWLFLKVSRKRNNDKTINVQSARDQREHLLTYLFAMLVPLFDANLGGYRDLAAVGLALLFIIFLFWYMRLHYMNIFFALRGYRIYTVEATIGTTPADRDRERHVTYAVLSKRHHLPVGENFTGWRLGGGNVLVDKKTDD